MALTRKQRTVVVVLLLLARLAVPTPRHNAFAPVPFSVLLLPRRRRRMAAPTHGRSLCGWAWCAARPRRGCCSGCALRRARCTPSTSAPSSAAWHPASRVRSAPPPARACSLLCRALLCLGLVGRPHARGRFARGAGCAGRAAVALPPPHPRPLPGLQREAPGLRPAVMHVHGLDKPAFGDGDQEVDKPNEHLCVSVCRRRPPWRHCRLLHL